MGKALIRLGDRTSHGGRVTEASGFSDAVGVRIARVGDKVSCPIPGHHSPVVTEGDETMIVDGKAVARDGDKISCGAVLIASQQVSVDMV
jgi:uncharacterized Zn-binding protein involved in type VI secretion